MKQLVMRMVLIGLTMTALGARAQDMSIEEEFLIKAQIQELVSQYAITRDNNDAVGYSEVFTPDGELIIRGSSVIGRDAIRQRVESANPNGRSMHVMSTGVISVVDATRATGIHYGALYLTTPGEDWEEGSALPLAGFSSMGKYFDDYVLTDEGWKIERRRLEILFTAPN